MVTIAIEATWTRIPDPNETIIVLCGDIRITPGFSGKVPDAGHIEIPSTLVHRLPAGAPLTIIDNQYHNIGTAKVAVQ